MQTRTSFSQSLLEYGFRFFETVRIAEAGHKIGATRIWKGESEEVNYGVTEDLYVTVPRGESGKLKQKLEIANPLIAPVNAQQTIGTLSLLLNDETLVQKPLVALNDISQAGIFSRVLDSIKLMLE